MIQVATHLAVAGIAAALMWAYQDARFDAELADAQLITATQKLDNADAVRQAERAVNTTYQGALNAARTREALQRLELDRLRVVSDGLRDQNADAGRRLATAAPAAVAEYAAALGVVFDDCRAAYVDMAGKAQGHAADVRTQLEAWPVMPAPR